MKTAISLPDALFEKAERLAANLGLNRGQLFACALEAYIERHDNEAVMERLNQVYAVEQASVDEIMLEMQTQTIRDEGWRYNRAKSGGQNCLNHEGQVAQLLLSKRISLIAVDSTQTCV